LYVELSPIKSVCISAYPSGSFATDQAAEAAALRKARRLIDTQDSNGFNTGRLIPDFNHPHSGDVVHHLADTVPP
jgi:hypothetical protein